MPDTILNISNVNNVIIHPQYNVIIIGYTEIALKSNQVRKRIIERFQKNIRIQFYNADIYPEKVYNDWGRLFVKIPQDSMRAAFKVLPKIFGVYYFSPAIECDVTADDVVKMVTDITLDYAGNLLQKDESFGVRAKMVGYPEFSGSELSGNIGFAILNAFGTSRNLKVNLTKPTRWIFVEVRNKHAYIYSDKIYSDWTGNPMELSEGALALTEGTISDFVSAFLLLKRSCYILPVIFSDSLKNEEYTNEVYAIYEKFMQYLPIRTFFQLTFDFEPILNELLFVLKELDRLSLFKDVKYILYHRIGEWILKNQFNLLKEIEKTQPIETDSNLYQTLSKARASQLKLDDQRENIRYISLVEGNQSFNLFKDSQNGCDILFKLKESSEIPIFRAGIGLTDEELQNKFGLIHDDFHEKYDRILSYEAEYNKLMNERISQVKNQSHLDKNLQDWLKIIKKESPHIPIQELVNDVCKKILELHFLTEEFHPECLTYIQLRKMKIERKIIENLNPD
jgi:adenylyl- and sulfurtransferase ThiI